MLFRTFSPRPAASHHLAHLCFIFVLTAVFLCVGAGVTLLGQPQAVAARSVEVTAEFGLAESERVAVGENLAATPPVIFIPGITGSQLGNRSGSTLTNYWLGLASGANKAGLSLRPGDPSRSR